MKTVTTADLNARHDYQMSDCHRNSSINHPHKDPHLYTYGCSLLCKNIQYRYSFSHLLVCSFNTVGDGEEDQQDQQAKHSLSLLPEPGRRSEWRQSSERGQKSVENKAERWCLVGVIKYEGRGIKARMRKCPWKKTISTLDKRDICRKLVNSLQVSIGRRVTCSHGNTLPVLARHARHELLYFHSTNIY